MKSFQIPELDSCDDARVLEVEHAGRARLDWTLAALPPQAVAMQSWESVPDAEWCRDFAGEHLIAEVAAVGAVTVPLVLLDNFLEGNHRLAAALLLNLPTVPIYVAGGAA